jgi:hypothetical protein
MYDCMHEYTQVCNSKRHCSDNGQIAQRPLQTVVDSYTHSAHTSKLVSNLTQQVQHLKDSVKCTAREFMMHLLKSRHTPK